MPLHVIAGIIYNQHGEILLARRSEDSELGGLWEFPGGKVEIGESAEQALARELKEEIEIFVQQARPLIRITHQYPKRTILLEIWKIEKWRGKAWGREKQKIEWCALNALSTKKFMAADYPVITAIRLPARYLITPEPTKWNDKKFFYHIEACLDTGILLIQLRAKNLSEHDYCYCAEKILTLCESYSTKMLTNATPEIALSVGAAGVHLNSERLLNHTKRPLRTDLYVAASCHNLLEIQQANKIKADFIVLSPVLATPSHPNATLLGWSQFSQLTEQAHCPVFALGGMTTQDIKIAWTHGGQGIAGIRGLC